MKYNLKTIVVGYEIPLLDLCEPDGLDNLKHELDSYIDNSDTVISSYIDVSELPTSNLIFKSVYIFKVNVGEMTIDNMNNHFNELKSKFESTIENFLKSNKLFYIKIESI